MTRKELRDFLEAGVNELVPAIEFGSGLVTDFNSIRSHQYPAVWQVLAPMGSEHTQAGAPIDTWTIELIVAQIDQMGSSPVEYQHIIDDCDKIAQRLIYQYRNIVNGYKLVGMTGVNRDPFVKKYADCLSGVLLTFQLITPDKTNVC